MSSSDHEKAVLIEPDLKFAEEVIGMGADDMKKCYQCATCSVVCPISPDDSPFPRKEMLWAQWGLKDRLVGDPGVFLCHQCGDCSDNCPRDAKPGDVLGAIRTYAYKHFATPKFLGAALSDPKYLMPLILFPVALLVAIMAVLYSGVPAAIAEGILPGSLAHLVHEFEIEIFPEGKIVFAKMFPHLGMVDLLFITTTMLVFASFFMSIKKFWAALKESMPKPHLITVGQACTETLKEFISHKKFDDCGTNKDRSRPHLFLVYSFIILGVVTAIVAGGFWVFDVALPVIGIHNVPNPWHSPLGFKTAPQAVVKVAAIVGAALLVYGIVMVMTNRMNDEKKTVSSYQDWFLIGVMLTVAVTGILSWTFRVAGVAMAAYSVYFIHLASVFMLIAYFPFSKFAHVVYRFVTIVYTKHIGADVKL